eukprot:1003207-Pleurochrysis_carterae.AAC.5
MAPKSIADRRARKDSLRQHCALDAMPCNKRHFLSLLTVPAAFSSISCPPSSYPQPMADANATASLPAPAAAPSALYLPLPKRLAQGDLGLVPARLWQTYDCHEHGGKSWLAGLGVGVQYTPGRLPLTSLDDLPIANTLQPHTAHALSTQTHSHTTCATAKSSPQARANVASRLAAATTT